MKESYRKCLTPVSQEGGNWVYSCQGLSCNRVGQGLRHVGLTPVVFQAQDGKGSTRDLCAECCTANNNGDGSARSFRFERRSKKEVMWRLNRSGTAGLRR